MEPRLTFTLEAKLDGEIIRSETSYSIEIIEQYLSHFEEIQDKFNKGDFDEKGQENE